MTNQGGGGNSAVWLLVGCSGLLVLGLCAVTGIGVYMVLSRPDVIPPGFGGGVPVATDDGGTGKPPAGDLPRRIRAEVTEVSGAAPVAVGAECSFDVEHVGDIDPRTAQCRTQIVCGGRLLYGGPQAGFFPCMLDGSRNVVGRDDQTTREDGDASMRIDTNSRELEVRDDGARGSFSLSARIVSVQ